MLYIICDYIYTHVYSQIFILLPFFVQEKTYHIYFSTSHNFYQSIYSRLYFPHFSNRETDTAKQSNFEKSRELTAADAEFNPSLYHLILLITKLYIFIFMYTYIQNMALG